MRVHQHPDHPRDRGSILPMVLAGTVVMSLIVLALATYVATGLRFGAVVEERADRLAAADGGMRYAVERLGLGAAQICTAGGSDTIDPPDTNGAAVMVTCQQVGDSFDNTNGWALIMTGEEAPAAAPLLQTQSGTSTAKLVGGPVYMSRLSFDTQAPIEFRYSQLLYTGTDTNGDGRCDGTPTKPSNVTFDSTSLGLACTPRPWNRDVYSNGLFSEPNRPVTLPSNLNPAYTIDGNGCRIFQPGHYTTAPVLGSHNYFMSGNYLFDGFNLEIKGAKVTAGRRAGSSYDPISNGDTQFIPNTPCDTARDADVDGITTAGVTFYLQNGARFTIGAQGTFEILRRKQGKSYVGVHVLDGSLSWDQNVIEQGPGTNKDMAIHGLVWAPEARITFSEVTNTANGQLLGGAVISNVDLRSSASANDFVIAVEPSDITGKVQLDSVAVLDGGVTTIRSIVDYRPSTRYIAVTSWRVIE